MFGEYEDKFKQFRTALLLMMTYPGKKMLFMGTEFGQFREWDYAASLEWFMLDYKKHHSLREYVAELNRFYLKHEELWRYDFSRCGFEWILTEEKEKNLIAFSRTGLYGKLTVVINFSGCEQVATVPAECECGLKCIFDTEEYTTDKNDSIRNINGAFYVNIRIPPFSGRIYTEKSIKFKIY